MSFSPLISIYLSLRSLSLSRHLSVSVLCFSLSLHLLVSVLCFSLSLFLSLHLPVSVLCLSPRLHMSAGGGGGLGSSQGQTDFRQLYRCISAPSSPSVLFSICLPVSSSAFLFLFTSLLHYLSPPFISPMSFSLSVSPMSFSPCLSLSPSFCPSVCWCVLQRPGWPYLAGTSALLP